MQLQDIKDILERDAGIKKVLSSGYFLGSVFIMLEQDSTVKDWRLIFYNPSTNMIIDSLISRESGKYKADIGYPVDSMKQLRKIVFKDDIELENAIEIARKEFSKIGLDSMVLNYLVSFHCKKISKKDNIFGNVWSVNVVFKGLTVMMYDIDAASGNIVRIENMRLVD